MWWQLLLGFGVSFVAGYLGSVVGLVLGTLRLPAILLLAEDPSAGAGTNIAVSAATAASGSLRLARDGRVDRRIVRWMAPPSIAGAVVGAVDAVPENSSRSSRSCSRGRASTCSSVRFASGLRSGCTSGPRSCSGS